MSCVSQELIVLWKDCQSFSTLIVWEVTYQSFFQLANDVNYWISGLFARLRTLASQLYTFYLIQNSPEVILVVQMITGSEQRKILTGFGQLMKWKHLHKTYSGVFHI